MYKFGKEESIMKAFCEKLEALLELGGIKKDVTLLVISGIAVLCSLFSFQPFPFDIAWVAIVLCGLPIICEAFIGLVTAFDIKADVLVSLALIASVCIGEDFAAGEVTFIMQLGGLLEELTVARARAGIEKLVHRRRPGCSETARRPFSLPRKSKWATTSGFCRARVYRWMVSSPPGRPLSIRPS